LRTSTRISEDSLVNDQGETGREDVRERSDRCVGPTVCLGSPDGNSHQTTSDITGRVGGKANGRETPDDRGVAKPYNHRHKRGGDVEIGVVDASPDDYAKDEGLTRKSTTAQRKWVSKVTYADEFVEEYVSK
jgi:hypothetical protein